MTKRILGVCLVLALPATFLVACGGDDKADSTTTTASKSSGTSADEGSESPTTLKGSETPTTASGNSSGGGGDMSIDEFCSKAKELAGMVNDAKDGKNLSNMKQMTELSTELAAAAQKLAVKVAKDPSLAQKYEECSREASAIAKSN